MKVTFFSNFLNDHQIPFCDSMFAILGEDFKFIATERFSQERIELGFSNKNDLYSYCIRTYESEKSEQLAFDLAKNSDVVIFGSAPEKFFKRRLIEDKLTFRYLERFLKKSEWRILSPRTIKFLYKNHFVYKNKKVFLLCASAFTSFDFSKVSLYSGKTFKWGYFPKLKIYELTELFLSKPKKIPKILWVGRFIKWKHPEYVIEIAKLLHEKNYQFQIELIGSGEMEKSLLKMLIDNGLESYVSILGSMPPEEIRLEMEKSNIFLFTSDFNEGWGVVLNESMNSGCAVIASHAIGSVPFLIKNGVNGLVYKNGNIKKLFNCVELLLNNMEICEDLGREAYSTIKNSWNSEIAAQRFLELSNAILSVDEVDFSEGPCSMAKVVKNNWWK